MKISSYFEKSFLNSDKMKGNFVINDCSQEFMELSKEKLSNTTSKIKPPIVIFEKKHSKFLKNSLSKCINEDMKYYCARTYLSSKLSVSIMNATNISQIASGCILKDFKELISIIESGDMTKFLSSKTLSLLDTYDELIKSINEIHIFLNEINDIYLQKAINDLIFTDKTFSLKIFTSLPFATLSTSDNFILETPYHYLNYSSKIFEVDDEYETFGHDW